MSIPAVEFAAPGDPPAAGVAFLKGHGTENDFVLIPDADDALVIGPELVRALSDRRAGIGADGVIRVVRSAGDRWFMDYRNADGSLAEMCGNGARVFARYLYDSGSVDDGPFTFDTLGGPRTAERSADGRIAIGMGPVTVARSTTTSTTTSTTVRLMDGSQRQFAGVAVDVGNPHLVAVIDVPLTDLDLTVPPTFDAAVFPHGVNIEFVTDPDPDTDDPAEPGGPDVSDAVAMRVFERGVGETRSCGTGTVAVAAAHLAASGRVSGTVTVTVPGGVVAVTIAPGFSVLTGPAVIVGSGHLDPEWWAAQH